MQITRMKKGRVYTYSEVKEIIDESVKKVMEKRDVLTDALCADHERAMLTMCLRALQLEGFQKAPMERVMGVIADLTDGINEGRLDYEKDIQSPVELCLGYAIEDNNLLDEMIERVKNDSVKAE